MSQIQYEFDDLIGVPRASPRTLDSFASLPQWVAWREIERGGKLAKVPFNPNAPRKGAKANDRATWGTREVAQRAVAAMPTAGGKRGLGLQLGVIDTEPDIRVGGVDLDSCLNDAGALEAWAAEVIDRFASYAEVSPSGTGIKIFFLYRTDDAPTLTDAMRNRETGKERYRVAWSRGTHCEIGLDVANRYYTVTSQNWAGCSDELRVLPIADLLWLIQDAGPKFVGAEGSEPKRDESGSAHGFRFLKDQASLGFERDAAMATLIANDGPAGEWARRTDDRQLSRAWEAALKHLPHVVTADDFDDLDDLDTAIGLDVDPVTKRLNARHAVVVVRGRTLITTEGKDGSVDFGTVRDIHAYYENDRVAAGDGKTEPASRRWMRNADRRSYPNGVTFAPAGTKPGTLNLWRGWAVEADATASCDQILSHILNIVCRGNADHADYIVGWLAHMVQHPEEKPGVALVLRGVKGAGKDTLAEYVARMIGRRHAPTVAESDHIVGKFNARLENALLLHVQEGSWAGDRKAESVLKYLVTSDRIEIERKGIDSINLPSVLRLFISANAEWVVPATADERRWAVFEVSDAVRGNEPYFASLRAEMNGSGPAALLHYLRTYDLSNFNVRAAPETEGLRDQKVASLRNVEAWWFERLACGTLPGSWDDWSSSGVTIPRDAMRADYVEWMKARRFDGNAIDDRQFGKRLRTLLPSLEDRRPWAKGGAPRVRQYAVPALNVARDAFDAWIGAPINWESAE